MNDTTKIETIDLAQTTFGAAEIGSWYLTTRGHRVQVVEVCDDHAIVESRSGKQMRVPGDQVAFGPEVQPVDAATEQKAPVPPSDSAKTRTRDPRLPEPGNPIRKTWRRAGVLHEVVATELANGSFGVSVDGVDVGAAGSLTAAAALALAKEGITSGVNGFAWFGVGRPAQAPRASMAKSAERLQAEVDRLQKRFTRAAEIAARLESDLEAANGALAEALAQQAAA